MSVQMTFIRNYLVQELLCATLLLAVSLAQTTAVHRCNRILCCVLIVANCAQFAQELTYAWTAYYVSVYLHSARALPQHGFGYDQVGRNR